MKAPQKRTVDPALTGSMHVSTSNLMSYSLVTMATMLAFYFAFQVGMLVAYAYLYDDFLAKIHTTSLIAKCVPVLLLGLILVFNVWSYKIVRVFIDYFSSFVQAGAELEQTAAVAEKGSLYRAMLATYKRPGRHGRLFLWTRLFFLCNSALWVVLAIGPIVSWLLGWGSESEAGGRLVVPSQSS